MRLRVQTLPPLPHLKQWFFLSDPNQLPTSILDLKGLICSQTEKLETARVGEEDIMITLEGFELSDEAFFSEALKDGDLICLEARPFYGSESVEAEDIEVSRGPETVVMDVTIVQKILSRGPDKVEVSHTAWKGIVELCLKSNEAAEEEKRKMEGGEARAKKGVKRRKVAN